MTSDFSDLIKGQRYWDRDFLTPHLSVILPAYNEERRIERCLDELFSFLPRQGYRWEIIAVDDGSTDTTWQMLEGYAREFAHFYPIRREHAGKGRAVKIGMLAAKGTYRMFMDVDLSTPLTEIPNALSLIRDHEIVIGSRELSRGTVRATWSRRFMGRLLHALISDIIPAGIRDTQCGFKMFRDYAALDLFHEQKIDGVAFDVELLYLAGMKGYTVKEFPVTWTHNSDSRMTFSIGIEHIIDVMRIPMSHKDMVTAKNPSTIL